MLASGRRGQHGRELLRVVNYVIAKDLGGYNVRFPPATGRNGRAAIDPLRTFMPPAYHDCMRKLEKHKPVEKPE